MANQMNPIYKETRRCFKAGIFTNFVTVPDSDGSAAVYNGQGKFIALFASRLIAEREISAASVKCGKFIQF